MRQTMHNWPTELPEGRWSYVDRRTSCRSDGMFRQYGDGSIIFMSDSDVDFDADGFEPCEHFEPIGLEPPTIREQQLERRVAEIEAELATQLELVKILQGRLDLQISQVSPFKGGLSEYRAAYLEPVDLPVSDVMAYLAEALPDDPEEFFAWIESSTLGGYFLNDEMAQLITLRLRHVLLDYRSDDSAPFPVFCRWLSEWIIGGPPVTTSRIREELATARKGLKGEG